MNKFTQGWVHESGGHRCGGGDELKLPGSSSDIMGWETFRHDQISRAAELGLRVSSPREIELHAVDPQSEACRASVLEALNGG